MYTSTHLEELHQARDVAGFDIADDTSSCAVLRRGVRDASLDAEAIVLPREELR